MVDGGTPRGWEGAGVSRASAPDHDDDLVALLGRRPSRRPWLEMALKQGAAAAVAYAIARQLPVSNGVVIVAPATAATILQGTTSGTARKALDTVVVTLVGILFGIALVNLLDVSVLSVLLTVTLTVVICRPLPLSSEAVAVIALNSLFAGAITTEYAGYRVAAALIGAAVALLVLLLVPQRVPLIETRDAISAWAFRQRDLLCAAADWLEVAAADASSEFRADVAGVYAARRAAREQLADLDRAVASQWLRRGSAAERELVHQAYEALVRIQPHAVSIAFIVEEHSRHDVRDRALPRGEIASLVRDAASLVDARTQGAAVADLDLAAVDDATRNLVSAAVAHLGAVDEADGGMEGAWDLLTLLSGVREITRVCRT